MNLRSALVTLGNHLPSELASRLNGHRWTTSAARTLANRVLPESPTIVTVRSGHVKGLRLCVFPRSEKFLWTGTHEPQVQDVLYRMLSPGMTFWDIGAHVGYFTLLGSRLVGPTGVVHAFEPVPQTFARLMQSVHATEATNVVAHEIAVAAETGATSMHGGDVSVVWSIRGDDTATGISVRCQTLADSFAAHGAPDLIKLDAEGAEADILASGKERLADHGVPVLLEAASLTEVTAILRRLPFFDADRVDMNHWLLTVCHRMTPSR